MLSSVAPGVSGPADNITVAAIVTLVDDSNVYVTAFPPPGQFGTIPVPLKLPLEPSEIPQRGQWWWPPRT